MAARDPGKSVQIEITVDDRESASGLPEAVAALWTPTRVGRLAVGDVEVGPRVIVERKTVHDLVVSLRDGRLFRQAYALGSAAPRPLLIVEGEDGFAAAGVPPDSLRGLLLTLTIGYRIPLLRTGSTVETAVTIARIAEQEARRAARRGRPHPDRPSPERAALAILGTIPGIGDEKARRLVETFGSVRSVAQASEEELTAAAGIGRRSAGRIHEALSGPADRASGPGNGTGDG